MTRRRLNTPLGPMMAQVEGNAVTALTFGDDAPAEEPFGAANAEEELLLQRLEQELTEYARGQRTVFDLPLRPAGTAFQRRVWSALREIPYGERRTYGEIAAALSKPDASRATGAARATGAGRASSPARATGAACGKNPILLLIPCHRVVGKNGALTGFSAKGGLETKRMLLELEQRNRL